MATTLDSSGLVAASAHIGVDLDMDVDAVVGELNAIGSQYAVLPALGFEDPTDAGEVAAVSEGVNRLGAALADHGITLGYHNHWWEFQTSVGGVSQFDAFRAQFDPGVFFEVDVYWATVGGVDAAQLLSALGDRARLLHVKDGPADGPDSAMTAVGGGSLDIPAILDAASAPAWNIVELDRCATDMMTAVAESFRYLSALCVNAGAARSPRSGD